MEYRGEGRAGVGGVPLPWAVGSPPILSRPLPPALLTDTAPSPPLRCGGQGYLSCNRFGQILGFAHAGMTAEGDNRCGIGIGASMHGSWHESLRGCRLRYFGWDAGLVCYSTSVNYYAEPIPTLPIPPPPLPTRVLMQKVAKELLGMISWPAVQVREEWGS